MHPINLMKLVVGIDSLEDLKAFIASVPADESYAACSIDTEADSMHSYETKLCLIQFSMPGKLAIVDPLVRSTNSKMSVKR